MNSTSFWSFISFFWEKINNFLINFDVLSFFTLKNSLVLIIIFLIIIFTFNKIQNILENEYFEKNKINKIKKYSFSKRIFILLFVYLFFFINHIYIFNNKIFLYSEYGILGFVSIYFLIFSISFLIYSFFVTDLKYKFVPNNLNFLFILLSFIFSSIIFLFDYNLILWNLVQSFFISFPFFLLYIYSDSEMIGGADWKVIFSLSLLLGNFNLSYLFITISFVIGAIMVFILFILEKIFSSKKHRIFPLIPFLFFGFMITYFLKIIISF